MIALSGVRSSWLMLARKLLLVRLACSASSFATRSSTSRAWMRSSMSLKPSIRTPSSSSPSFTARSEKSSPRDTLVSTSARCRIGREITFCSREAMASEISIDTSVTSARLPA